MATIGLDRLYYAKITENDAGEETYGTPSQLAKAISADLSVELAEAMPVFPQERMLCCIHYPRKSVITVK